MTHVLPSFSTPTYRSAWSLWFAQPPEPDLALDDGFDDLDDEQHKPPSRRPLLIILLLLLVAGAGYFAMNPDLLTSFKDMIVAPGSAVTDEHTLNGGPESHSTTDQHPNALPSPTYLEGEVVSVVAKAGDHSPVTLSRNAQGTEPGPTVATGELLTVVDGAFINHSWLYLVHTKSGATGWIDEHHIQPRL